MTSPKARRIRRSPSSIQPSHQQLPPPTPSPGPEAVSIDAAQYQQRTNGALHGSGRRASGQGLAEEQALTNDVENEEGEEDDEEDEHFEWRCTKCRRDDFAELAEFHSHIFECALK